MHVFKVFEVGTKGERFDTGKTVEFADKYYGTDIVNRVCKLYGFDKFVHLYHTDTCGREYYIWTTFHEGRKTVWIVSPL